MYPAHFYGLFPAFPRRNTVFVAMSFDSKFDQRWSQVIEPAIASLSREAVRVDQRMLGDSILTEILSGIGSCQVVLADISTIGYLDSKPVRNGNVMYEVGLAHAVRLPEEVILFRSDNDQLPFDTANIRVNTYSPESNPEEAKAKVVSAVASAIREVDLRGSLAVQEVVNSLDAISCQILIRCGSKGGLEHPNKKTFGEALSAVSAELGIQRLLTLGLVKPEYEADCLAEPKGRSIGQLMPYVLTRFGKAVFCRVADRMLHEQANS